MHLYPTTMKTNQTSRVAVVVAAALLAVARLGADVIETKTGARILGKVTKIDAGSITVDTDYAGTITVKQDAVKTLTTDDPVAVRLESGTRFDGRISTAADGSLQIAGSDGTITTPVSKVTSSWKAGEKDPQLLAMERHWAYEAAVDITGKTGAFHDMHRRVYGISDEGNRVEFVSWKMTAVGHTNPRPAAPAPGKEAPLAAPKAKSERAVCFEPGAKARAVPVYDGSAFGAASGVRGPAIIEEETTTLLLLPGMAARVDADGNYWVECS